jgi:hypothetical protein
VLGWHSKPIYIFGLAQILVSRAETDYPKDSPPPLRAIRSCSSSLAPATLEKLEAAFKAPVLEASGAAAPVKCYFSNCSGGLALHCTALHVHPARLVQMQAYLCLAMAEARRQMTH